MFMRIPHRHDDPAEPRRDYSKVAFRAPSPDVADTFRSRANQWSQDRKGFMDEAAGKSRAGDFPMQGQIPEALLPGEDAMGYLSKQRLSKWNKT